MRLDHIAYRVADREAATKFFIDALGYRIEDEFEISFDDDTCAQCYALTPSERSKYHRNTFEWTMAGDNGIYHMPPEIFVSEGSEGSIVKNWVTERGGIGGVHHLAYQVSSVKEEMNKWIENKWATFTTDEPIVADGLTQCFTKEHVLTGIIYELLSRTKKGFNIDSVRDLMESTIPK